MAITFHCESCKKKITARDDAGGKWGKCPYCNHRCYVPMPEKDDDEEFKLAPVDESDETRYERMMRETHNITEVLLHQKESPPEPAESTNADDRELTVLIIRYLRQMADGQLDEAQTIAEKIVPYRSKAKAILEGILNGERPEPELANVPKKVLTGFIRNMLTRTG